MTVVAIPYRPDHGHRDRLFTHLKDNYWNHVGFPLSIGRNDDVHFNRSKAINQALEGDWDIAVIADADTWVPAKQLHQAIVMAKATGVLVAAFDAVVELSRDCTLDILDGKATLAGSFNNPEKVRTRELETQSSMLVITRSLWDKVGGMDERFTGWGCEDNAFWKACALHAGEPVRVTGNAYHLWHVVAPGKRGGIQYKRNLNLWHKYQHANTVDELP